MARGLQRDGLRAVRQRTVGVDRRPISAGQLVVFGKGDALTLTADLTQHSTTGDLEVLLLGGTPLREPVIQYGPFVMNTRQEIIEAMEDFNAGRMGTIPAEHLTGRRLGE